LPSTAACTAEKGPLNSFTPTINHCTALLKTGGSMSAEARVRKIIVEQLGVSEDEVKLEASFVDDLGADSLDLTELIMAMEEAFEIEIEDEEAQKLLKVQDAVAYVEKHMKK
jgi:acyl carrier protein